MKFKMIGKPVIGKFSIQKGFPKDTVITELPTVDFDTFKRQLLSRERRFPSGLRVREIQLEGITDDIESSKVFQSWVKLCASLEGKDYRYVVNLLTGFGFKVMKIKTDKTQVKNLNDNVLSKRGIAIFILVDTVKDLKW